MPATMSGRLRYSARRGPASRAGLKRRKSYSYAAGRRRGYAKSTSLRRRPARRQARVGFPSKALLTGCARDYLLASVDPWSSAGLSPCVPDLISVPSHKAFYHIRGTMTTSATTGWGYVALNPYSLYNLETVNGPIAITGSTYATAGVLTTTATTGVAYKGWNNNYTGLSNNRRHRCVAAGIKLVDISQTETREGTYHIFCQPNNHPEPFDTLVTEAIMNRYQETQVVTVGAEPVAVTYHLRNENDFHYIGGHLPEADTTNGHVMCVAVQLPAGSDSRNFYFDIVGHYEIIGEDVGGVSPSDSDIGWLGWIGAKTGNFLSGSNPNGWLNEVKGTLRSYGVQIATEALPPLLAGVFQGVQAQRLIGF